MAKTPLLDALRAFVPRDALPMHMPGHKLRPLPVAELSGYAGLDVTELGPTGDLFSGGGAIGEAEALWAGAFHMAHCLFLTGGSTQGVLSALTLACPPGAQILLDRGSHRSAYNALALLDLDPVYLDRPWLEGPGLAGPISPAAVARALEAHPNIKTVCITSPTYYGVLSDLPAIARAVHARGGTLVVDAAHGAHLPFLGNYDLSAADLVVASAHKTLPAPGQSALLFAGAAFSGREIRRAASLYGSSSPSYPMLAALDGVRAWLEEEGAAAYRRTAELTAGLRARTPALTEACAPLDPCRYVFCCADGFAAQRALEGQGVYVELADAGHVVCILTCADGPAELARLELALRPLAGAGRPVPCAPPPPPQRVISPRAARFSPWDTLPLARAGGRIAACQVAPYPPGVPVVAPGEAVTKKTIAYLDQIGYNIMEDIEVVRL